MTTTPPNVQQPPGASLESRVQAKLQRQLGGYAIVNATLESRIEVLQQMLDDANMTRVELGQQVEELNDLIEELQQDNENLTELCTDLERTVENLEGQVNAERATTTLLKRIAQDLGEEIEALRGLNEAKNGDTTPDPEDSP